jgi:hypothetical protein
MTPLKCETHVPGIEGEFGVDCWPGNAIRACLLGIVDASSGPGQTIFQMRSGYSIAPGQNSLCRWGRRKPEGLMLRLQPKFRIIPSKLPKGVL